MILQNLCTITNRDLAPGIKKHVQQLPTMLYVFFLILGALATGCSQPDSPRQTAYGIRTDFSAALNDTARWGAAMNQPVAVFADQPFRIRFEVEAATSGAYGLQVKRNDEEWIPVEVSDFPYPDSASPRVSIVSTEAYQNGVPTHDLLDSSSLPFSAGAGISLSNRVTAGLGNRTHSEWEWPLVIRRFADGAVLNNHGDTFSFRMVSTNGQRMQYIALPELTLSVAPYHVGGTFVETPGRIGPWEASNGDLYFIMEPTETDNVMMMMKSEDAGVSWLEVDGVNRPSADDLEGVSSSYSQGTIHILHQTSETVWYHAFHTSDHGMTDEGWAITDEVAATPEEPPTQVAAIASRSDGSQVGVYGGPQKIHYKIRANNGTWSEEYQLNSEDTRVYSGPQVVIDGRDIVHLAYTGNDGTAWYTAILAEGTSSEPKLLSNGIGTTEYDVGSVLPLALLPEAETVLILYRLANGVLWERSVSSAGTLSEPVPVSQRKVVQNPVDSDQTGADVLAYGGKAYVLFIEEDTNHIYSSQKDQDGWQSESLRIDSVRAQWIRGGLRLQDNNPSIVYIYDAGSNGGSGMNRFATIPLSQFRLP